MLGSIVRAALRYRVVVVLAIAGFALIEAAELPSAHYGVFPQFTPPSVQVQTAAPGLDPRAVELAVTDRIEQGLGGLAGVAALRSQSESGVSVVDVVFHGGTDVYRDRAHVAGRLASIAASLPPGVVPVIVPMQSATGTAVDVGLDAPGLTLMQLTAITETLVRPALRAVPGVANAVMFGAEPPQLEIEANPAALLASGFGLNAVAQAAHDASAMLGAGFLDTGNQQILLATHGQVQGARSLADSLLGMRDGIPITLGDVATIREAPPPRFGAALVNGRPGILLVVSSLYGANTLTVADGVEQTLARITPALHSEGVDVVPDALAPGNFTREALADLGHVLLIGAALILAVLVLALRDWRIALISFLSIPVSLLVAVAALRAFGVTLSIMALAGLAIALGEVVDDAVVDIENISRRLRENAIRAVPAPALGVILAASLEVRRAIIFATASVTLMFLPILGLGGVAGRIFAPLGYAYIAAIVASLLVALTLTPALAALLLRRGGGHENASSVIDHAKRFYGHALAASARGSRVLAVLAIVAVIVAGWSLVFVRTSFLPNFEEQDVIAHFLSAPGTSIDTMLAIASRAVARLKTDPDIQTVVVHIGRASLSNGHAGVNKAEIDITLSRRGNADPSASAKRIMARIDDVPGLRWWDNTFLTERIHESLSGFAAPLTISVFGPKLAALSKDAGAIAALVRQIPGVETASVAASPDMPVISITPERAAMATYGLTARAVLGAVRTGYAGDVVGRVYRGLLVEPIVVTLPRGFRRDPASLASLPVQAASGRIVPLGLVARIERSVAPALILHSFGRRVQVVTVQTAPGHGNAVLATVKRRIARLHLERGDYYVTYGGSAVAGAAAQRSLLTHAGMAFAAILALLSIALGNGRAVVLLALGLPLALAGGIAASWLCLDGMLNLGAMVGLVTLFGLSLRNGLLLLIHYRRLVLEEGLPWGWETARRGAMDRLPAILITAIVTALGLLPLALAAGSPGDEIEGPMAIVILGGLVTATALTLLVLPRLSAAFIRWQPEDEVDPQVD
ncbi:MAG: efflux RND transporter permease subunit [Acidiphilium sp.]|nr:efflux RND transporter permease subunit [Acidiphilium sp.]MDD4934533.1 efflux RND transporter permease subunit [Acidiphilium sp.]